MIISQEELDSLTTKRYGSKAAIDEWSNDLDRLLESFETLRAAKYEEDMRNATLQAAKRIFA